MPNCYGETMFIPKKAFDTIFKKSNVESMDTDHNSVIIKYTSKRGTRGEMQLFNQNKA